MPVPYEPRRKFAEAIKTHEGLSPRQTPYKATHPSMLGWESMYDDSIGMELDPNAQKAPGTENFLYAKRQEDIIPGIIQQFRNYARRPKDFGLPEDPTVEQAVRIFDQTGADGKIKYLAKKGIDVSMSLSELLNKLNEIALSKQQGMRRPPQQAPQQPGMSQGPPQMPPQGAGSMLGGGSRFQAQNPTNMTAVRG